MITCVARNGPVSVTGVVKNVAQITPSQILGYVTGVSRVFDSGVSRVFDSGVSRVFDSGYYDLYCDVTRCVLLTFSLCRH